MTSVTPSRWSRIAALPFVVSEYALERLSVDEAAGYERMTIQIRLLGGGADGLGEDVGLAEESGALLAAGPSLSLSGEWTIGDFCAHLATLEQWPEPPSWEAERLYRNWAYESAALDLALRQNGLALPEFLGVEPRPVQFVNSLGLGDPPSFGAVQRRLARYPGLRFKLDTDPRWTPALMDDLVATGAVDILDFKGQYGLETGDVAALASMYEHALDRFGDVILEDPHDLPEIAGLVTPHAERVSYDAPIHAVADLDATALASRIVNVKPSRLGSLSALFDLYDHCERQGLGMYGGGMGEIGVGRGQVQLLASMFHADAPNDVAPTAFNALELADGLAASPLTPPPNLAGFRWAG
jgi:L-alanine-DL-glutamate epimerase-like enolase superfamily enzyme